MSSAPTMIYRLVCVIVQDDHTGSPLRYHIENYAVSYWRMLTAPTTVYLLVFAFVQGDHAGSRLRNYRLLCCFVEG